MPREPPNRRGTGTESMTTPQQHGISTGRFSAAFRPVKTHRRGRNIAEQRRVANEAINLLEAPAADGLGVVVVVVVVVGIIVTLDHMEEPGRTFVNILSGWRWQRKLVLRIIS